VSENEAAQKVIQFLKEGLFPFVPHLIWGAAKRLGIGGDLEELTRRVLAEGAREAVRAIEGFFDALDIPRPDLSKVEACLRSGCEVEVSPVFRDGGWGLDLCVKSPDRKRVESWHHASPAVVSLNGLKLDAMAGLVTLGNNHDFVIVGEAAFFKARERERIEVSREAVESLRPFLSALGHEGLPEAFGRLGSLEKGESRLEGRYVLACGEDFWALRDWPIMGDPALDGAILLERDVRLDFPGGVEISFRVLWCERSATSALAYVRLGLGEESFQVDSPRSWTAVCERDIVTNLVQGVIAEELEDAEMTGWLRPEPPSARMLAFLKAFVEREAPFKALAEGSFLPHATAELFGDL